MSRRVPTCQLNTILTCLKASNIRFHTRQRKYSLYCQILSCQIIIKSSRSKKNIYKSTNLFLPPYHPDYYLSALIIPFPDVTSAQGRPRLASPRRPTFSSRRLLEDEDTALNVTSARVGLYSLYSFCEALGGLSSKDFSQGVWDCFIFCVCFRRFFRGFPICF